jgi:hypothetical protein
LFQAGYGYDIQVGRPYWFFGFGLQRLVDLGISLPLWTDKSDGRTLPSFVTRRCATLGPTRPAPPHARFARARRSYTTS